MKKTRINPAASTVSTSSTASPRTLSLSHEAISARAAALWEQRGRPYGLDDQIWLDAERELARSRANFDQEAGNEELDALFPNQSGGSATTSL